MALSFKDQGSLEILHRIVDSSDVIVENYIPGTLKKYGLDYETLSKRNPRLVYASITGLSHTPNLTPAPRREGMLTYVV